MRMGQDGVAFLKPEEMGGEVGTGGNGGLFGTGLFSNRPKPTDQPAITTEVPQVDTDIFDPVTEIKLKP